MTYSIRKKYILFFIFIATITLVGCPAFEEFGNEASNSSSSEDSSSSGENYEPNNESNNSGDGASGNGDDGDSSGYLGIDGDVVYPVMNMKTGGTKRFMPTFEGSTDADQIMIFSIEPDLPSEGFSFDTDTGEITIDEKALASTTTYTVTATGVGSYTGMISTQVTIHLANNAIDGTLSYGDTLIGVGTSGTNSGSWDGRTDVNQTVLYSISPVVDGITIDANGKVRVGASGSTEVKEQTTYTITATGTGNFAEVITATINITVAPTENPVILSYNGTQVSDTEGVVLGPYIKDTNFADSPVLMIDGLISGTDYNFKLGNAIGTKTADSTGRIIIMISDISSTNATNGDKLTLLGGFIRTESEHHEIATYKPSNIYDWKDLQAMRNNLAGDYVLKNDIVFPPAGVAGLPNKGFVPVGDNSNPFTGTLDGNGKKITDLVINDANLSPAGLFGEIRGASTSTVVVKNLTIENPSISAKYIVGGLVGIVERATITEVAVIENSTAGSSVKIESTSKSTGYLPAADYLFSGSVVGGIIGAAVSSSSFDSVTLTKSYSNITVIGAGNTLGGLAGGFGEGKIVGYASGDIIHTDTFHANYLGGLVGYARNNIEVIGYYTGDISTENNVMLYTTGGLVGRIQPGSGVSKIYGYATGDITGNVSHVGGLVGENTDSTGTLKLKGYYLGTLSNGHQRVGGLLGHNGDPDANTIALHGYMRGQINITSAANFSVGTIYGESAGTISPVGFHLSSGSFGSIGFYDATGTNVLSTSTNPTRATVVGAMGYFAVGKTVAGVEASTASTDFPGLIFGNTAGDWTYTSGKWPAINLGTDMPASAQAQPIDP